MLCLAACGSTQPTIVTPAQPDPSADRTLMPTSSPASEVSASDAPAQAAWLSLPLVNARTRETFTFADFAGKVVYVEPMATWCTNCRAQMNNLVQARQQVDNTNIVYVGLSVETNLTTDEMASYADSYGYDWAFAVMTPEILSALTATFGRSVSVPPSTPHFIIYPDGTFSALDTGGIETTDELVQLLREATA